MNPRCRHCHTEVAERLDGVWVHRGTRLQICSPLARTYATPEPAPEGAA